MSSARKRTRSRGGSESETTLAAMKRSRSDSRAKLIDSHRLLSKTVLAYQHPVTGLLPAFLYQDGTPGWARNDAWVRDNVYSVFSIWGMSIAYRRRADTEDDRLKAYELEQSVVKLMRGLLTCMMSQAHKLEQFKTTLYPLSALHAKYSLSTCSTIVGDHDWGHLQIDATSLYLLALAQMTAAGLQIVFTLDEVAFVQNLVFYIEEAYRIPDYGIWERGDKTNHGQTELNASSIGMAKAALEAMSELDLFGSRGSESSVIHVMHDQVAQSDTKLNSLLPRESSSKEIDAALLTIIGFPAFAVENPALIDETKEQIISKLLGKYGCRRFLRDGYQTVMEDSSRLHYEPAELKVFENIECEWPLFLILLALGAHIEGNHSTAKEYLAQLEGLVPKSEDGVRRIPELYLVPKDKVNLEKREPHSQTRVMGPKIQHMWSQSLYVLTLLLMDGQISIGEIDPLNRRLSMMPRPDTLVQVVLLSEDKKLARTLSHLGIDSETIDQVERNRDCPVKILPAKFLMKVYEHLGVNKKMCLSGRPPHMLGVIATSQLYNYSYHSHHVVAFTPQFLDHESFYLCLDNRLLVDLIRTDLAYLKTNWKLMGRPTIVLPILRTMFGDEAQWEKTPVFKLLMTLISGYTAGVRIQVGRMTDFLNTASIRKLHFINQSEAAEILDIPVVDLKLHRQSTFLRHQRDSLVKIPLKESPQHSKVRGSIRRSRQTPPLKRRSFGMPTVEESSSPATPTPEQEMKSFLNVALRWPQRRHSLRSDHLPTGPIQSPRGSLTPSPSFVHLLSHGESLTTDDVVQKLQHEPNIFMQADYLNHLYNTVGKNYVMIQRGQECTVADLLEELYQKAGIFNLWTLVRHTAGMLHKRVEDLGPAATDLLVRQKNFSVGQPANEKHIAQPATSADLMKMIVDVCGVDHSAVALTQEILVYLAMFIRSEPELFTEMLRLRIGLIQNVMVSELSRAMSCTQILVYLAMFIRSEPELFTEMLRLRIGLIQNVMVSELSRAMSCTPDDAVEKLLDLSPFYLKHLLHLIFSSKEFTVDEIKCRESMVVEGQLLNMPIRQLSITTTSKKREHGKLRKDVKELGSPVSPVKRRHHTPEIEDDEGAGYGHWLRRRRLDGALNRVPPDFYTDVWHILEKCRGIIFGNVDLPQNPTIGEMTPGELKFALILESKLNSLPDPEYRQLVVEVLMVVSLVAKSGPEEVFGNSPLVVDHIINHARHLFLQDQKENEGPAVDCCCKNVGSCGGPAGICIHFYDSAPSGRFGTMSYVAQAVADQLRGVYSPTDQCKVS